MPDAITNTSSDAGLWSGSSKVSQNSYTEEMVAVDISEPSPRIKVTTSRIVRDTAKAKQLKAKYEYCCQVCGERLEVGNGEYYAEVHHLQPRGGEHQGLDEESNMLVLCPNHHALFDYGIPRFLSLKKIEIGPEHFQLIYQHSLSKYSIDYHNKIRRIG